MSKDNPTKRSLNKTEQPQPKRPRGQPDPRGPSVPSRIRQARAFMLTILLTVLTQIVNIETDEILPTEKESMVFDQAIQVVCWYSQDYENEPEKFKSQQHCAGVILLGMLRNRALRTSLINISVNIGRLFRVKWRSVDQLKYHIKVVTNDIFFICLRSFACFMSENVEYADERDIDEYGLLKQATNIEEVNRVSTSSLPSIQWILSVVIGRMWREVNKLRFRKNVEAQLVTLSTPRNQNGGLFHKVIGDPFIRDIVVMTLFGPLKSLSSFSDLWGTRICETTDA